MNDHVIAEITQARTELLESVHSFPDPLFTVRPGEAEWSAGEVVAHLALVEQGIVAILHRLLEREKEEGGGNSEEGEEITVTLPPLPAEKIRASQRATPEQPFSKNEAIASIAAMRQTLQEVIEEALPYNLHRRIFPHIILGDLNFYQWILFIGAHTRRHTAQIARVRTTLDANA